MPKDKITKDLTIEEVLEKYPETVKVFIDLKIPCLVCGEPLWGTVEETSKKYNVPLDTLLSNLNKALEK
ncbi:DUF1858 domain-containing protein [candidate division WOR-3 bacterium]|nr:DUF1858 domain-containing protein [candidate division WOR-3 bacterium]